MRADDLLAASFPAAVACPETLPPGDHRSPDGPSDRAADDRRLPDRGDGRRRPARGPRGAARRVDRARRGRHRRAVGLRARHPDLRALHLPRRRPARGAPHAGGPEPPNARHPRARRSGGLRSRRRRARCAKRPGPAPNRRRSPRGAAVDGLRHRRRGRGWTPGSTRWPARTASCTPTTAGSPSTARPIQEDPARPARSARPGLRRRSAHLLHGEEKSLLLELERDGAILRTRLDGRTAWCERRFWRGFTVTRSTGCVARSSPSLPASSSSSSPAGSTWTTQYMLEGPRGVAEVVGQLAGFEVPAAAWETHVLPRRVRGYRREWLDQMTAFGRIRLGPALGRRRQRDPHHADRPRAARAPRRLARASPQPPEHRCLGGPARDLLGALPRTVRCSRRTSPRPRASCRPTSRWAWPTCWRADWSPATRSPHSGR